VYHKLPENFVTKAKEVKHVKKSKKAQKDDDSLLTKEE
jgi:hypothetical protein